jgi:hypothetical protein
VLSSGHTENKRVLAHGELFRPGYYIVLRREGDLQLVRLVNTDQGDLDGWPVYPVYRVRHITSAGTEQDSDMPYQIASAQTSRLRGYPISDLEAMCLLSAID